MMRKLFLYTLMIGALLIAHLQYLSSQTFVHPGGLVTQDDIDRILYLMNSEKDPTIISAFDKLKANSHAQYTYSPNAQVRVDRGGTDYPDNYPIAMNDVAAAYQNALMWRISGDTRYADCAVRILNAWAITCKDITGDTNASLASGIYGYEFAQAGELLRGYSGWAMADFKIYQSWMRNLWYPRAMYFLEGRHGHAVKDGDPGAYFSNWGLCNLLCVMSIGVLCDDMFIYNQGLSYYKEDKAGTFTDVARNPIQDLGYNEFLGNLVVWLHPDSRGPLGYLGQMQESGRDQGHATMAAELATDVCQTAWNQGDDLYGLMSNRLAAGIEYIALVNSLDSAAQVNDSVPFIPYERTGFPTENYTATVNGLGGWGSVRPMWDRVVAHFEGVKGIPMHYARKMVVKTGIDGGGGDYGSNSGGFDQLGFTTLTNYRPTTWYPAAGHFPMTLGASIKYKGVIYPTSSKTGIIKGDTVTLTPSLPVNVTDNGTWRWETGETTRERTFSAKRSGIYRVTYTSGNGTHSTQAFSVAVWGDCTPDIVTPYITVGTTNYQDTIIDVLPYQSFSMSIKLKDYYYYGSANWSTGATGSSVTISNGVRTDSTFWVEHTNFGGYKTRINFHVKLQYVTPSVSVDGGTAIATNTVTVQKGQNVEMKPVTTTGYDTGTFRWSTGHTSKSLAVLNIQKSKHYQVYYTLTKKGVTTIDTLNFYILVVDHNYQLKNGDYYIQNATDSTYLTNTNATASTKVKPTFGVKNSADSISQLWTITKETATDANGRFKIVSKKDGNYVNEKGNFGTNAYLSSWNTYTLHSLEGQNLFAIQNGGNSGTAFWTIGSTGIELGTTTQNGYPFIIKPVIPQLPDTTTIPGEGVVSYIIPYYSLNGGLSQFGNAISIAPGKSLVLKPVLVSGISGGTWLWNDNSTANTLTLNNVQNGGSYTVTFTYPTADTVYKFRLTYVVKLAEDNYVLPAGDYRILRASDNHYLTNDGTLYPVFSVAVAANDSLSQMWTVTQDATSLRNKIVSHKDNRFLEEHGRFNNNVYDAAWNTYLFHYTDSGERIFAIQNAGSSGSNYWAISGDYINSNATVRSYPFKFELVKLAISSGVDKITSSKISVYPNPVADLLTIRVLDCDSSDAIFDLYSVDGHKLKSLSCKIGDNYMNTIDLSTGLYFGILSMNGKTQAFKIVKK